MGDERGESRISDVKSEVSDLKSEISCPRPVTGRSGCRLPGREVFANRADKSQSLVSPGYGIGRRPKSAGKLSGELRRNQVATSFGIGGLSN